MILVVADHAATVKEVAICLQKIAMYGRMTKLLLNIVAKRILITDVSIGNQDKSQRREIHKILHASGSPG